MRLFKNVLVGFKLFHCSFSVDDGTDIHPAVLATIRKLEDGYFGGARYCCNP